MELAPQRSWYCFAWWTWLAMGILIWALIAAEREQQFGGFNSSLGYIQISHFGWPWIHVDEIESGAMDPRPGDPGPDFSYEWHAGALALNLLTCLLLMASTFYVCEIWLRSANRWQFSLRSLLAFMTMLAGILVLVMKKDAVLSGLSRLGADSAHVYYPLYYRQLPTIPIVLALICTCFAAVSGLSWFIGRASSSIRPRTQEPSPQSSKHSRH